MKRDIIKALHKLGIRYADKPGVGRVKLEHFKFSQLCAIYAGLPESAQGPALDTGS